MPWFADVFNCLGDREIFDNDGNEEIIDNHVCESEPPCDESPRKDTTEFLILCVDGGVPHTRPGIPGENLEDGYEPKSKMSKV